MILKRREAIGWIKKVRNLFWPEIGFHRAAKYISHKVNRISGSPHAIALGIAAGTFASFTPFIGFHFIVAALIAWIIGGNLLASAIGTSIGNPLTFPFIWFVTHNTGSFLLGQEGREEVTISAPAAGIRLMLSHPAHFFAELWTGLEPVFLPMCIGSIPLGLASGIVAYLLVKPAVAKYKQRRQKQREKRLAELRKRRRSASASQQEMST